MENKNICANLPPVLALAYLGDARHALYVRLRLVEKGLSKSSSLNSEALKYVTAEAQAKMYSKIEGELTSDEADVFKRAFNSTHLNKPKRASGKDYRVATGFEAVIGMLTYLGNEDRLRFILDKTFEEGMENDTEN